MTRDELLDALHPTELSNDAIAEIAALYDDAQRYRWLREGDNDEYVLRFSNGQPVPVMQPDETAPCFLLRVGLLDAAIDAEMAKEPQP